MKSAAKTHTEAGRTLHTVQIDVGMPTVVGVVPRTRTILWDTYGKDRDEAVQRLTDALVSHLKTRED